MWWLLGFPGASWALSSTWKCLCHPSICVDAFWEMQGTPDICCTRGGIPIRSYLHSMFQFRLRVSYVHRHSLASTQMPELLIRNYPWKPRQVYLPPCLLYRQGLIQKQELSGAPVTMFTYHMIWAACFSLRHSNWAIPFVLKPTLSLNKWQWGLH